MGLRTFPIPETTWRHADGGVPWQVPSFEVLQGPSLVPGFALGLGTPTFVRATTAYQQDFSGNLNLLPAGAARMQGARIVTNGISNTSEDLTSVNWTSVLGWTSITATTATTASGNNVLRAGLSALATIISGHKYRVTFDAYVVSGATSMSLVIDLGNEAGADQTVTLNNTLARYSVLLSVTTASNWLDFERSSGASGIVLYLNRLHVQDVTGQTDQSPGDYVSVGVLAAPYHGLGADGIKAFDTLNGNTVASNVVTEATGAAIVAGAAGVAATAPVDAGGPFGYLAEGARTNLLLQSRDMTNIAWTAGATMTVARTSVGVDGAPNSANRLTAGAVTATNIITQLITAAASTRTYSAYIKRITGTGPVRLSEDNFTGGTDVSASLVANQWVLVQFTASVLNAVVGIKIDTNTDAIDVDMNQFEAGVFASSPIPTTTVAVARNADALTYPSAGNISGTAGSVYVEAGVGGFNLSTSASVLNFITDSNGPLYWDFNAKAQIYDGTTSLVTTATTALNTVQKMASSWSGSSKSITFGGNAPVTDAFDGDMTPGSAFSIGIGINGATGPLFGHIRNVRIYPTALSAAQLTAMTTP